MCILIYAFNRIHVYVMWVKLTFTLIYSPVG